MTKVRIPDAMLRRALDATGLPFDGHGVDPADLARVVHLDWSEDGIGEAEPGRWGSVSDLRGLEHATGLRTLGLGGSALRNLGPLKGHATLEELWVNHNELADLSAIDGMPRLRIANLDSNRAVTDVAPLAGAPSLTYVNLSFTKVSDLAPLRGLTRLTKLALFGLSFPKDSPSFELLVDLVRRGGELNAERALLDEVRREVERLNTLDAEAKRDALAKEKGADAMVDALMDAGLSELAALWKEGGARARDASARTLLHLLAAASNVDDATRGALTRALVEAGADVNAVQLASPATTPLGVAVASSSAPTHRALLLELGADPNAGASKPPLLVAAESGDEARIGALLDAGANVAPALARIVETSRVDVVKRALTLAPGVARTEDLVRAVKRDSLEIVRALLDAGVDVNGALVQDAPVLHHAESVEMFDALLAAGADVNAHDVLGSTPLMAYLRRASWRPAPALALIERAVRAGASASGRSKTDGYAIHVLASARAPEAAALVPVLAELGADLHALTAGGKTAMDLAGSDAMKAALKAAKVATGKTVTGRLAKQLAKLEAGDADALRAAKVLAGHHQPKLLAPFAPVLAARLHALDEPLATAFAALPATSEPVVVLLADGVTGTTSEGAPLLHALASWLELDEPSRATAIRALLAAGADPDALDRSGTPALNVYLDYARGAWDVDLVAALAGPGAVRPAIRRSALAIALGRGASAGEAGAKVIELLLERGAELEGVADAACFGGRLDILRRAVEGGAAIPTSALHSAVFANALEVARYLLEHGADPNQGATVHPLIVNASSVEMLDLLLAHGGEPFVLTSQRETPLHFAARLGVPAPRLLALVERLEALGLPRTLPDGRGTTPLAILQARPEPEIQAYLTR